MPHSEMMTNIVSQYPPGDKRQTTTRTEFPFCIPLWSCAVHSHNEMSERQQKGMRRRKDTKGRERTARQTQTVRKGRHTIQVESEVGRRYACEPIEHCSSPPWGPIANHGATGIVDLNTTLLQLDLTEHRFALRLLLPF